MELPGNRKAGLPNRNRDHDLQRARLPAAPGATAADRLPDATGSYVLVLRGTGAHALGIGRLGGLTTRAGLRTHLIIPRGRDQGDFGSWRGAVSVV